MSEKKKKKQKPPTIKTLMKWESEGFCKTPDGCKTDVDGKCEHGLESWMLILGYI